MRLLFVFFSAALALSCTSVRPKNGPSPIASAEPPSVAGILRGETVLSGEVVLTDDVLVPAGSTLVLRPGTIVHVRSAESTKIDPEYLSPLTELLVRGALRIEGTVEQPVRFLPAGETTEEIWWAGIILDGATATVIEGAELSGAETGLLCLRSSPRLRGNLLTGCRYGIIAQAGSAPEILDNRIQDGEGGVFCWRGSSPRLEGNRITGHQEEGLFIDAQSRPLLGHNLISGNGIGLVLYRGTLDRVGEGIGGNREDRRWLGPASGAAW